MLPIIYSLTIMLALSGCGKSSVYQNPGEGYTPINNIDNLSFFIPLSISNQATAITEILDNMEYSQNIPYSFKNGNQEYVFFCMDQLIILAEKGTSFGFADYEDKKMCLENSGVVNTWFSPAGKKLNYIEETKNGIYKLIADVNAEVVITSDLYGDYIGKLAVISDGMNEWGLFIGTYGASMKELSAGQAEMLNNIALSMHLEENPKEEAPQYEVVIDQSLTPVDDIPEELQEVQEEDTNADTVEETGQTSEFSEKTEAADNMEETIHELPAEQKIKTDTAQAEKEQSAQDKKEGLNRSNQKNKEKEIGKAYQSDEYSMLSLSQAGILTAIDDNGHEQTPVIRINKIYKGTEAVNKIKAQLNQNTFYGYFDPPEGYSWEVAEYDVSYDNCESMPYINIMLAGVDGGSLIYRGIKSSSRTHDANYNAVTDGNNIYGNLCYYPVPNGCKEYALICGEGNAENDKMSAYYLIKSAD